MGALSACLILPGCGSIASSLDPPSIPPPANWSPIMSQAQMDTVRQTFPNFISPKIAPGTDLHGSLSPSNFAPAVFFGYSSGQNSLTTPMGVQLAANGYDGLDQPVLLPDHGTYYDSQNNPFTYQLGTLDLVPLNKLEERMHVPLTAGAPILTVNRRSGRVDPAEVDRILIAVRDAFLGYFGQTSTVDIRKCQISIEPSIFYVQGSNFGSGWAGASTQQVGNNNILIRLSVFYISGSSKVLVNWQMYLVDEAINFYALSIGRPDLAE